MVEDQARDKLVEALKKRLKAEDIVQKQTPLSRPAPGRAGYPGTPDLYISGPMGDVHAELKLASRAEWTGFLKGRRTMPKTLGHGFSQEQIRWMILAKRRFANTPNRVACGIILHTDESEKRVVGGLWLPVNDVADEAQIGIDRLSDYYLTKEEIIDKITKIIGR